MHELLRVFSQHKLQCTYFTQRLAEVATQNRNVKHIKITKDKKMSVPQNEVKT